jgi:hypothetical protein
MVRYQRRSTPNLLCWYLDRVQGRPRNEIETYPRPASGLRLSDHVAEFRGRTDPSQSHAGDPVD